MEREDCAESLCHQRAQESMCARVKEKEERKIVKGREWRREAVHRWKKWNRWRTRQRWGRKREMKKKRNKTISLAAWKKFHVQEKWCRNGREDGAGRERHVVAVEEEGKEVEGERKLLSPWGRSSPGERSFPREREGWKKEKKREGEEK